MNYKLKLLDKQIILLGKHKEIAFRLTASPVLKNCQTVKNFLLKLSAFYFSHIVPYHKSN